ncbi:MAG: hypothetical protein QF554_05165 [Dehalococcoidia bacterium]|jgi:hypothetical protein|nr:hypothetical protein [Dehalococcoidia bacterium]
MTTDSSHIPSLSATIAGAIEADRIGRLVFVRWMEHVESDPGVSLELAMETVSDWFGQPPESTHTPEGSALQASVLARWPGGETALLITVPVSFMVPPGLDLAVIGAKGAIYHSV